MFYYVYLNSYLICFLSFIYSIPCFKLSTNPNLCDARGRLQSFLLLLRCSRAAEVSLLQLIFIVTTLLLSSLGKKHKDLPFTVIIFLFMNGNVYYRRKTNSYGLTDNCFVTAWLFWSVVYLSVGGLDLWFNWEVNTNFHLYS